MSSNSNNREMTTAPASQPIPINTTRVGRGRSFSVSSASSGSTSSPEIQTPVSSASNSVRIGPHSPGTSPIFNYFFNQQTPTKTASQASYPFKKMGPPPVFEEEEKETTFAAHHHARRASASFAGRYVGQPQASTSPEANYDGGAGLLRRLSIGNPFAGRPRSPPDAPPNSAVSPASPSQMPDFDRRARSKNRRQTISSDLGNRRRAPSPMGERILKGHFDGFN